MAKRRKSRKLWGAALAAHQKKARKGGARKARKSSKRRRHVVKSHKRKGSRVRKHMSNPIRRWARKTRRNPAFGLGQAGSATMEGLVAAGVLFGALVVVGFANRQTSRFAVTSSGWGNLAAKLAIALGASYAAMTASRKGWLSRENAKIAGAAAWAPLALGVLSRFTPQVAGMISLADDDGDMSAELSDIPGNRISDHTMDAELSASLLEKEETENSSF